jgi:hypothetical protein
MTTLAHKLLVCSALIASACNKKADAPAASSGSSAGSSGGASGSSGAADPWTGSGAPPRPAAVTDEMVATFEVFVVAFNKLVSEVSSAGTDCAKAAAIAKRQVTELAVLAPQQEKLKELMTTLRAKDAAAGEWFGVTYGPRMKLAMASLAPLVQACKDDAQLKAAMGEAMSRFPMMRKKQDR